MARIRTIKPDFWTDEKIVELSAFARLLFIGLWNFADDEGRMAYSPKKIKMQIFPADTLDISELFGEIRGESLISIYTVDNIEYLQIKHFAEHQKIDKRTTSKLPSPPTSPELPRIPTTEGKGREGKGINTPAEKPAAPSKKPKSKETPIPENFSISDRVKSWAEKNNHTMLAERFEHFVGKAKAKGYWYIDWDQALENAIREDWANFNGKKVITGGDDAILPNGMKRADLNDQQWIYAKAQGWL